MEGVRRAEIADLDRCRELVAEAIGASSVQRGASLLVAAAGGGAHELVDRWHDDPSAVLLAGTYDGVVVGVAAGTLAALDGRRLGRVECCYVEPDARAVGVGSTLVETLVAWFAEQGCTDVDALALPGDRSTKQLFESSGFKARLLVLHRSLD
jgi:N-acetylglutamate synthase-like GNAT family acetyltransferase